MKNISENIKRFATIPKFSVNDTHDTLSVSSITLNMDSKTIATIFWNKLSTLKKILEDLPQGTFKNRSFLECMRCVMPDVSFYLTDSKDDLTSFCSTKRTGFTRRDVDSKIRGRSKHTIDKF